MKLVLYVLITAVFGGVFGLAMASTWQEYAESKVEPAEILKSIVSRDNTDDIVKTKLDDVEAAQGGFPDSKWKIANTLDSVRQNIRYYLQRAAYIGLAGAVMLIIYNGLRLVLNPLDPDEATKVKKRIMYITMGIILITGFYFVLKILLAIYYDIFAK